MLDRTPGRGDGQQIGHVHFKVSAWTKDPASIPAAKTLLIAEPEIQVIHSDPINQHLLANVTPYLQQKRVLQYPVDFHLRAIFDFGSRTPSSSGEPSHSDDGDSGLDGNPDCSYGFHLGSAGSPRISALPRRDGGGRANGGGSHSGGNCFGDRSIDWARNPVGCGGDGPDRSGHVIPKKTPANMHTEPGHQKNFPPLVANRKEKTNGACRPGQRSPVTRVDTSSNAAPSPVSAASAPDRTPVVDKAEELVLGLWRGTASDRLPDPMRSEASVVRSAMATGTVPTAVPEAATAVSQSTPQSTQHVDRPVTCDGCATNAPALPACSVTQQPDVLGQADHPMGLCSRPA